MDAEGMQRTVTAARGRIKRAWAAAILHLRDVNPVDDIAARIAGGREPLRDLEATTRHFANEQHTAYVAAGQAEARWLDAELGAPAAVAKKLIGFDLGANAVIAWAARNQLEKIRQITDVQRAVIREILLRGAREATNPREMAREIQATIGLTESQLQMVQSYREALERGQYALALERQLSSGTSDRVIAAAQRAGRELTRAQIDTAVARYLANAISMRAETIARTEGLRVAHQGAGELIRQAVARNDIQAAQIVRTWATSHLPNVRDTHRAMDKQERSYDEPFETGGGVLLQHPGDPDGPANEVCNCACAVATRIRPPNRPAA